MTVNPYLDYPQQLNCYQKTRRKGLVEYPALLLLKSWIFLGMSSWHDSTLK